MENEIDFNFDFGDIEERVHERPTEPQQEQNEGEAPPEKDWKAEYDRLNDRYKSFAPLVDEVEKDPSLIHDIRAAAARRPNPYNPSNSPGAGYGFPQQQPAPPPQQDPRALREEMKRRMTDAFINDPGEAMLMAAEYGRQAAAAEMNQKFGRSGSSLAQVELSQFRAEMTSDAMYPHLREQFEAAIAATPQDRLAELAQTGQLRSALQAQYDVAAGQLARKQMTSRRAKADVPPIFGGARGSTGSGSPGPFQPSEKDRNLAAYFRSIGDDEGAVAALKGAMNEDGTIRG